jgi:hypothetical protein
MPIGSMITTVVQLILAGVALWSMIEARKLRLHAVAQLDVVRRQHMVAVAPYLLVGATPKDQLLMEIARDPAIALNLGKGENADAAVKNLEADFKKAGQDIFFCEMTNATSKIALGIEAVHYNARSRNFIESAEGLETLGEGKSGRLWIAGKAMNQADATTSIINSVGNSAKVPKLLTQDNDSYIVVFFRDIEGSVYAVKRAYIVDNDGDIVFKKAVFEFL